MSFNRFADVFQKFNEVLRRLWEPEIGSFTLSGSIP